MAGANRQPSDVSFSPQTGPPTVDWFAPNGDYHYTTTSPISPFDVTDLGTLTVLADDTVSVLSQNALILQSGFPWGPANSYAHCSTPDQNCITPFTLPYRLAEGLRNERASTLDVSRSRLKLRV